MTVTFGDPNYETEEVLKVRDITKSYDGREILHNVSFNIRNRERVALLGANGAGKTTMLKILLGEEVPDGGVIRKGVGLKPAYLPQQVYFANPHRNLIDTLIYDKNVSTQVARNRLGSFQFTGETQLKTVDMLSGGEKSRLRLCELMYDPLNLLILSTSRPTTLTLHPASGLRRRLRHSTARCCLFRMTVTSSSALQPACCISKTVT